MLHSVVNFMLFAMIALGGGNEDWNRTVLTAVQHQLEARQSRLDVVPSVTYPGDAILVRSNRANAVTLFQQTYRLLPYQGEYVRFIPIPFEAKPGNYSIESSDSRLRASLTIQEKKFAVDVLTVSDQLNSMRQDQARIDADQRKIDKARSVSSPTPYFREAFLQPAAGRLTTPYGYQRVINGVPANRHRAIDIANKTGTKVLAANNGKVVLADSLYLTGNTIIIDHGLNLFSIYAHLSEILVQTGEEVKRGQTIGLMGSTGFSTGPHLHFGMLVGNTYVNPQPFFEASPFLWK